MKTPKMGEAYLDEDGGLSKELNRSRDLVADLCLNRNTDYLAGNEGCVLRGPLMNTLLFSRSVTSWC